MPVPAPSSSFFRTAAERLSRNVVFSRKLSTSGGPRKLWVTPEASLRYWLPGSLNSDQPLIEFLDKFVLPGSRFWDVGSNVGIAAFHSAARVKAAGSVLAIEADPFLSSLILRSIQELPPTDCKPMVLTIAISDKIGLEEFAVPVRSRASNYVLDTGGCTQTGGVRYTYKVASVTLDWLLENTFPPDVIKLDIEGMEARALRAAPKLLTTARPILNMEVWDEIADDLTAILHEADYVLLDGEAPGSPIVARATWGTIAVPREKRTT